MARPAGRAAALAALVSIDSGERLDGALLECDRRAGDDARERRLARRLVRGVSRRRGRLDWIIGRLLRRGGPDQLDRWSRNALRLGIYQILYLTSVPSHAAVYETVHLARVRGGRRAAGLVNALLRALLRDGVPAGVPSLEDDPVGHLAVEESYPPWLVSRWVKRLGIERAAARLRAGNRMAPLSLRILEEGAVGGCAAELEEEGIRCRRSALHGAVLLIDDGGDPTRLALFREGRAIVQDEAAAVIGLLAEPLAPVESVLDICSAPGGKLLPVACRDDRRRLLVAADLSPARLRRLSENIERLALPTVLRVAVDGLRPAFRRRFDLVFADVPCTGLGTLARHADLRWRVAREDIDRLGRLALRLLRSAAEQVEPGGVLIYSTCSTEPEENGEVIDRFLESDSRFRIEPPAIPPAGGVLAPDGTVHVLPEEHGCDGAFGVRLRRSDD